VKVFTLASRFRPYILPPILKYVPSYCRYYLHAIPPKWQEWCLFYVWLALMPVTVDLYIVFTELIKQITEVVISQELPYSYCLCAQNCDKCSEILFHIILNHTYLTCRWGSWVRFKNLNIMSWVIELLIDQGGIQTQACQSFVGLFCLFVCLFVCFLFFNAVI